MSPEAPSTLKIPYSVPCGVFFFFLIYYLSLVVLGLHIGFSLVAASEGYSALWCVGLLQWLLLFQITGSRHTGFSQLWHMGSVALQHVDIFPGEGSNLCPLFPTGPPGKSFCALF